MPLFACLPALAVSLLTTSCTTPTSEPLFAFRTAQSYDGDLVSAGGNQSLDGLGNADLLCNRSADQAGLPGTYTAWLSDSANGVSAIDRLSGDGPWRSVDSFGAGSSLVFASRAGIAADNPQDLIQVDVGDATVPPGAVDTLGVWTGTDNDGTATGDDCGGWTGSGSGSGSGSGGFRGTVGVFSFLPWGETWSDESVAPDEDGDPPPPPAACTDVAQLYCFEN
ncbi:MAG TPA: hypothetical protein VGL61_30915 [Kofleriaceae bacterium]